MAVVLVVDDEKEIAQLLDVCLKSEGFETIVCYTAQQAEQAIEQERLILRSWMSCCPTETAFPFAGRFGKNIFIRSSC